MPYWIIISLTIIEPEPSRIPPITVPYSVKTSPILTTHVWVPSVTCRGFVCRCGHVLGSRSFTYNSVNDTGNRIMTIIGITTLTSMIGSIVEQLMEFPDVQTPYPSLLIFCTCSGICQSKVFDVDLCSWKPAVMVMR